MGWKINVLDACDKEQPAVEPNTSSSEDLQSRGSIQYTTRVKPDLESNQNIKNNEPLRNYIDQHTNTKEHNNNNNNNLPAIPIALEEYLKNDFHKTPTSIHREQSASNNNNNYYNFRLPQGVPRQNQTMYAYPISNNTYGNVPFYMPAVRYGNPQPMNPSVVFNYLTPSNNNNYRPVRHPAVPHYQAQPTMVSSADHRGRPVQAATVFNAKLQQVPVKHGYHRVTGTLLSPKAAHHSVVYKKPIYKLNPQPVKTLVAASPYGPALPQPTFSPQPVYPSHFQPQPSSSVSQSVSVSYSSSKQLQQRIPPPIQNRQETTERHNQFQGGFNPNTVVVEGGFRPIVPPSSDGIVFAQDRTDRIENDDVDGMATITRVNKPYEKKTNKKLISRKPAHAKHATEQSDTIDTTTAEYGNRAITENAEYSKQTAEIVVSDNIN